MKCIDPGNGIKYYYKDDMCDLVFQNTVSVFWNIGHSFDKWVSKTRFWNSDLLILIKI